MFRCVQVSYSEFLPLQTDGSWLDVRSLTSVSSWTCVWSVEVTAFSSPGCWRNDATRFRGVLSLPAYWLLLTGLHKYTRIHTDTTNTHLSESGNMGKGPGKGPGRAPWRGRQEHLFGVVKIFDSWQRKYTVTFSPDYCRDHTAVKRSHVLAGLIKVKVWSDQKEIFPTKLKVMEEKRDWC